MVEQGAGGSPFKVSEWQGVIGQEKVKERLQIKIQAAVARYEQMDHCLILGPSGSGKSTIANLIAEEHGVAFLPLMITPNFKLKVLNNLLINFEEEEGGGVVLLDEVHCLTKSQQHYLYSILEDGYISFDNGKKHYFQKPITIVAATTDEKDLTAALRGRFGAPYRLDDYTDKEMAQIIERMAYKAGLDDVTRESCLALGRAAAGSPRQAADLVKTARDLGTMTPEPILKLSEITPDGLTVDHVAYLEALRNLGGTGGLKSLSQHSGRAEEDIANLEKLLVKKGLVEQSRSGRVMTARGLQVLGSLGKGH